MNPATPASTTLTSSLASRLREDIINGVYAPGSRLRTKGLCERYGVSLIPMREALSRLASSGFVQAEDQRGFHVPEVSAAELVDITCTRLYVEKEALRRSIENGDLAWETRLIAAHHRLSRLPMQQASHPGVTPEWDEAHVEFHSALLSACDSKWLLNLASMLRDQTARYRHLSVQSQGSRKVSSGKGGKRDVAAEHQALLDAALKRDVAKATQLLEKHFQTTTELVLQQSIE